MYSRYGSLKIFKRKNKKNKEKKFDEIYLIFKPNYNQLKSNGMANVNT